MTEETKEKLFEDLLTVTNVLLLDANKALNNSQVMFICGIIAGRQIPFFKTGYKDEKNIPVEFKKCNVFENFDDVMNNLKINLPYYIDEENKKFALKLLYKKDITFNADNFAKFIEKNNLEMCNLFFQAGMDVNISDSHGVPMICRAARKSNKKTMIWLLDNGAKIDVISEDRGYSAVMDAVWKSNEDLVELLCERGANLSFISRDGQSVLVLAIGGPNSRICDILIKYGADPYIKDKMGMSAFDYATLFKQQHLLDLIYAQKEKNEA